MNDENRDPFSDFSKPMAPSNSPSSGRSWVLITAMICGTTLLLCGGLIGLGFYAVDRLAEPFAELSDEPADDDENTVIALRYALADDPTIEAKVGEIVEIRADEDLTYDFGANDEDYFYTVVGDEGQVTVVCQFSLNGQAWFESVELIDGPDVDSPRNALVTRNVPFDTVWSKRVWDVLQPDESLQETLDVGEVKWIQYEYREFDDGADVAVPRLEFEITGDGGSTTIVGDFRTFEYEGLKTLYMKNADGSLGDSLWTADREDTVNEDGSAAEQESPTESSGTDAVMAEDPTPVS